MTAIPAEVRRELRTICGDDGVLESITARYARSRVVSPFPLHRWSEHVPELVVLPRTTEQVSAILAMAQRRGVPVTPRAGGTGYHGAVPRTGQVVLDIARMNQIVEIDPEDMTATAQAGVNLMRLSQALAPHGLIYPDDPGSFPCAFLGGRIGTNGWSMSGGRFGHTRDLVLSFQFVLPTGQVIQVGDGGGRKLRKSSTGYQLKQLFMGHQGTLGVATEVTVEAYPKPEAEVAATFEFDSFDLAWRAHNALARQGVATLAHLGTVSVGRAAEAGNGIGRGLEAGPHYWTSFVLYGTDDEVRPAARRLISIALEHGGRYQGDEISQEEWASRHKVISPLVGRNDDGQVVLTRYFFEDAAVPTSAVPRVLSQWQSVLTELFARHEMFVPLGIAAYANGAYRPWAGCLTQIGVGFREDLWDDEGWTAWARVKAELARIAIEAGGSISGAHGAVRPGEPALMAREVGAAETLMRDIKTLVDPAGILNPGKFFADQSPTKEFQQL